jgi:ABC-type phosphate/phosphonate transport system substrate-binding protein
MLPRALALLGLCVLVAPADADQKAAAPARVVRVGAVAYAPSAVTVFEGMRRYFAQAGQPLDYVLYSNYDALVQALRDGQVDIAWNTPLAHAQYHLQAGGQSRTLAMRDVDCNYHFKLIARKGTGIRTPEDLAGKTLVLGSRQAAEATVLPIYYLKRAGVPIDRVKLLSLDREVDFSGNPCCSPQHVVKTLADGRGDAGIIGERLWEELVARHAPEVADLTEVWTSPGFSHCVFTASKDFDPELGARFRRLLLAMDCNDPRTAEVMRLEGTRKWVDGSQ